MGAVLVQFVVTLIAVLALIAVAAWAIRMFMGGRLRIPGGRTARLGVIEAVQVDARRKLVLVRRDQFEHLLLIGGPTDVVVEPTIFRGVPLTARLRPDMSKGAPAQHAAPQAQPVAPPEVTLNPPARQRRAPEPQAEEPAPAPQHRLQSTPAAAFAPPSLDREPTIELPRISRDLPPDHVVEDEAAREAAYTAPLPPEAPAPLAQPPRTPPMRHEPDISVEQRRVAAAIEASVALDQLREARNTLRMTAESVKVAPPVAAKAAVGDDPANRVGLWESRGGPRYEILGPPRAPTASAAAPRDADLEAWSHDGNEEEPRSGAAGPTPEQISNLEQEMARLLGEIAGKRTS
jgi:hypothetical protein